MNIFGVDYSVIKNQLLAVSMNIYSWGLSQLGLADVSKNFIPTSTPSSAYISIPSAGGYDKLEIKNLGSNASMGYNCSLFSKGNQLIDISQDKSKLPQHLVIVKTSFFSINYADVAIRWGLYESALRYIGWPIIPGFDFSGVVEWAGSDSGFQQGEKVFGFSLFGAYSSRVIVDMKQIRKLPENITLEQGAALPAVSATALHAISLSGGWPGPLVTSNKAALIHSAAGGVGSMLIQMCKIAGYRPIVAVVGNISKAEYCKKLGADHVVVKSEKNWWEKIENISADGYTAIFDANGLDTLFASYSHLSRSGRLVTYGFHSNLPKSPIINPISWLKLIYGLIFMPKFDPMAMVLDSKSVLGFNLSFFAEEHELISLYLNAILNWIETGLLLPPETKTFPIEQIGIAHKCIQSGLSIGKILIKLND